MNEIAIIKLQLDKKKTTKKQQPKNVLADAQTKQRLRGKQHIISPRPVIGLRRTRSAGTYGFRRLPS